jgi:O-antigen/teichoic acid export membrane protein
VPVRRQKYLRLGVATLDQFASSLSNVLFVFALARVSDVAEFGKIGLVLTGFSTALAASRGLLGTPIALLSHDRTHLRDDIGHALSTALLGGIALSLCMIGATATTDVAAVGLVISGALPLVLAQDVARYAAISDGHPGMALSSDSLWAAGSLGLLAWTWLDPHVSSLRLALGWALLSGLSLALLAASSSFRPRLGGLTNWWRLTRSARLMFGGEAVLGAVTNLVVMALIALILAPSAVAALRGAGSVMGPLSIFMSAIALAVVPELRRDDEHLSAERAWRHLSKLAIAMSALSLGIGVVAWLTPSAVGRLLLGDTWSLAHTILPITAVEYAAIAWVTSAANGLRAQARSGELIRLRAILTTLTVAFSVIAALVVREVGAVSVALACAAIVTAVLGRRNLLVTPRTQA